ncbi:helix-turn-helix domain-containing protein [Chitinophaga alhagiae]|uniref:helix-turn-helix domain-containing protein n=1 Tax=Chitinophaga alhagiae TaxID=2203219 RepID=UPI000E5BCE59|nr:helix-turn-helix domain-containing protein [Chitinophaga alhagiae]
MQLTKMHHIPLISFQEPSAREEGSQFMIQLANLRDIDWEGFDIPHRHDGYTIDILLKGSITQYIDFEKHTIHAPAVIMLDPEQIHQHDRSSDAEILALYFTRDFLITETLGVLSCWQCVFKDNVVPLEESQLQELLAFARILLTEFRSDKPRKEAIIRNVLSAFIIACGRIARPETAEIYRPDNSFNSLGIQFKILVDEHFREKVQVSEYAEMLHVTPGHLNDTVKNAIGRSAKQIIDAKRIMEAKRLLFWQKHSVKQIAGELNFDDDAYFSRFFKKHTGQTPALFQKTIREKYN